MKHLFSFFLVWILSNYCWATTPKQPIDSLIQMISAKEKYDTSKEETIAQTKSLLHSLQMSDELRYQVNQKLCQEYQVYVADSAIHYALENREIAQRLDNQQFITDTDLNLASYYIITGMYHDAVGLLRKYHSADLLPEQRIKYFTCYKSFYDNYKNTTAFTQKYSLMAEAYRDSLLESLPKSSAMHQLYHAERMMEEDNVVQAKQQLQQLLQSESLTIRERAMASFVLAHAHQLAGDKSAAMRYYALSAMHDIEGNIKENTATRALASCLYEERQIERAYICIRSSMEDAAFCNARLRTHEVSSVLPIIDVAYRDKINAEKRQLKILLILAVVLAFCLVGALLNINLHMRKNASIRRQLRESNDKLEGLNESLIDTVKQLNAANDALSGVNTDLSEANRIKEFYIAQFLDLCSNYIIKLEKYQNTLNKKAAARQLDELYKILKSKDMINEEVKELYRTFDHVFLHLYPNFISDFNDLLLPEERFILKDEEELNIELRIFALIRLGITDSSRIAQFLHYSPNTIYTYRTRVRNKSAVPRDTFEEEVMKLGAENLQ
ncbi:MAG: DUF6377 domain-containing protein [Mangrovibacterium sp.]